MGELRSFKEVQYECKRCHTILYKSNSDLLEDYVNVIISCPQCDTMNLMSVPGFIVKIANEVKQ